MPSKTTQEDAQCTKCSKCYRRDQVVRTSHTIKDLFKHEKQKYFCDLCQNNQQYCRFCICNVAKWKTRGTCEIEACKQSYKVDNGKHNCVHCHASASQLKGSSCLQCFDDVTNSNTAKNTLQFDNNCNPVKCKPGYELRDFEGEKLLFLQKKQRDGFGIGWKKLCLPFAGTCKNGDLIEQEKRTKDGHCGSCFSYELKGDECVVKGKGVGAGAGAASGGVTHSAKVQESGEQRRRRHLIETPPHNMMEKNSTLHLTWSPVPAKTINPVWLGNDNNAEIYVVGIVCIVSLFIGSVIGAIFGILYQKRRDLKDEKTKKLMEMIPEIIVDRHVYA
eukprot:GSMAST32.ASY1.ANO1.640.1 assembled CDS